VRTTVFLTNALKTQQRPFFVGAQHLVTQMMQQYRRQFWATTQRQMCWALDWCWKETLV
jgi:hypothetical protein